MLFKRAQAAMEFLMTYGWAILVVLIVVGALAYFGVLNPQNLIPEKCVFPTMLTCTDYQVASVGTAIKLVLMNGAGKDFNLNGVDITGDAVTTCKYTWLAGTAPLVVASTSYTLCLGTNPPCAVATGTCTLDTTKITSKKKYAINVNYTYTDSTYIHPLTGELFAKAG
jgi:hypothetical protein